MSHVNVGEDEQSEPAFLPSNLGDTPKQPASYENLKGLASHEANPLERISKEKNLSLEEQIKSLEAQEALLRLAAERAAFDSYHDLRKKWANVLRNLLYSMVGFEACLTFSVGFGWLHFPSQVFLNLIVGQTFLQIVGMCYIVVKFLFPNDKNPFDNSKPKNIEKQDKATLDPEQDKTK